MDGVETTLNSASDLGQTRINFNYSNYGTTTADFLDKGGRQHFAEGPHEDRWKRWLSVNPYCTDMQFQPLKAVFEDRHGNRRTAYWDIGIELLGSQLFFGEIKADRSFFRTEDMETVIRMSASALATESIPFLRLHGTDFDDISDATIKSVFDRRRTTFDVEGDVAPIIEAIDANGGSIHFEDAIEVLGRDEAEAEAKLCAMMCARHISIDLDFPLTAGSLVRRAPRQLGQGALRRFLARFVEAA